MPFTLLDHYILKKLMDYLFLGLVVFTLVLFFSDALLDFMKDLQHYGISGDIALTLIGLQIPKIVAMVVPMSALLATLMVYGSLNNHFELIAMRMSGISLYRLAMPAVIIGVACAIFAFLLHDYVVPLCNKYSRGLKTFAINQQKLPATQENFTYKQFDSHQQLKRLVYISRFNQRELGYSTVIDLTNPSTLQVIQAHSGFWGMEALELKDANVYTVSSNQKLSNTTHAGHLVLHDFIQPQANITENKSRELSFLGLYKWIQNNEGKQPIRPKVYVNLWEKLTVPLSSIPLVLIAVPLAITSPRRLTNLGFLLAVVILFLYYVMRHIAVQIGEHQVLPAFVATSLPLVVMLFTAAYLFRKKNKVL